MNKNIWGKNKKKFLMIICRPGKLNEMTSLFIWFQGETEIKKILVFFFVCWPFLKSFCFAFCFWSILDPPVFTRKPKDQYVRAVNDEVSISCDGTGQPKPNIYWRKVSNIKIFIWIYHMKWRRTCTNKHKHKQWRILFVRN